MDERVQSIYDLPEGDFAALYASDEAWQYLMAVAM